MKRPLDTIYAGLILILLAFVLLAAVSYRPAFGQSGAHGEGHSENHDWYRKLNQPGTTYSCCSNEDCRPTRAYQGEDGFWHALLNGQWVQVPKRAELKEQAPDGNSHICASKGGYIFCFIGGSPKS